MGCGGRAPGFRAFQAGSLWAKIPAALLLVVAFLAAPLGRYALAAQDPTLTVMTFNIRYGTAADGDHAWPNRRELVAALIREQAPDVLAIQEALDFQLQELAPVLRGYTKLGQHRRGGTEGEFSGLYVNEAEVELLDSGEFWLSPTPEEVGSVGWDAAITRMAVWADVRVRTGQDTMRVYGTHFDHRGQVARVESARLIAGHARGGPPTIVMGDLNVPEESEALDAFYRLGFRSAVSMLDPGLATGTFNGFRDPTGGPRIDHILLSPGVQARSAAILDRRIEGLFPSDHFPVVATVAVPGG